MKKIRQQTLCMLLAPILCVFCFQFSAVAAGSNEVNISLIESLRNVEPNKADFGLENVDFEDFQISSPIKSYVYTAEGFEESYEYQPLLIDGQLTAFAIKIWNDAAAGYQITTNLVSEINNITFDVTSVALIYDRIGCWLYDGEELTCLYENDIPNEQRNTFEDDTFLLGQLELVSMGVYTSLGYISVINPRIPVQVFCNISYVHQAYTNTCWAASITSILNYTGNETVTEEDVIRQQFGVLRNRGITTAEAAALLRTYGLNYARRTSYTGDTFINNLQNGYPIFAGFWLQGTQNDGHACVIYSYHILSCYMRVMDPECGSVYIPCPESGQEYTYVSPYSNTTLVLWDMASMYA